MSSRKRECPKPPCADNLHSVEMLRVWANPGHSCEVVVNPSFAEAGAWGVLLVDIARHAAKAHVNTHGGDENETIARIWQFAQAEWQNPTDKPTQIS